MQQIPGPKYLLKLQMGGGLQTRARDQGTGVRGVPKVRQEMSPVGDAGEKGSEHGQGVYEGLQNQLEKRRWGQRKGERVSPRPDDDGRSEWAHEGSRFRGL